MSILAKTISPRGALSFEVGYHPRKKIHVIRVVFQARQCTRVHCLGVQKRKKKKKERKKGVFGHIDKYWKGHGTQINVRKMHFKNTFLGSIFIPEKYVF